MDYSQYEPGPSGQICNRCLGCIKLPTRINEDRPCECKQDPKKRLKEYKMKHFRRDNKMLITIMGYTGDDADAWETLSLTRGILWDLALSNKK
jgi:hypothetical protein